MFCYLMSFTKQNSRFELINNQARKRGRNLLWRHIFIFLESRLFLEEAELVEVSILRHKSRQINVLQGLTFSSDKTGSVYWNNRHQLFN